MYTLSNCCMRLNIEINQRKLMLLWFKTWMKIGLCCGVCVIIYENDSFICIYLSKILEVLYLRVPYSSENRGWILLCEEIVYMGGYYLNVLSNYSLCE